MFVYTAFNELPNRIAKEKMNERDKLHNFIVDYLEDHPTARFSRTQSQESDRLMRNILDCLWYIDGQHGKFSNSANVPSIPDSFR